MARWPAGPDSTESELAQSVSDLFHFSKLARYDIAAAKAQAIVKKNPDPAMLGSVFNGVATQIGEDPSKWIARMKGIKEMSEPITQLEEVMKKVQPLPGNAGAPNQIH